jgi:hypothetical protein
LLIVFTCSSQDFKKTIEKEFKDYNNLIEKLEFEKSMQYLPQEFIELFSKSQFIKMMNQTYNNPSFKYEIKHLKIDNINDLQKIENKYYTSFNFSGNILIKTNRRINEDDEDFLNRIKKAKLSMEQSLGKDKVNLIDSQTTISINSFKKVIAISNNGKSDWKFLVLGKNQNEIAKKILPKQIIEKIKN